MKKKYNMYLINWIEKSQMFGGITFKSIVSVKVGIKFALGKE